MMTMVMIDDGSGDGSEDDDGDAVGFYQLKSNMLLNEHLDVFTFFYLFCALRHNLGNTCTLYTSFKRNLNFNGSKE